MPAGTADAIPASAPRWWLLPLGALVVGLALTIPFWTGDLDQRVAEQMRAWNDAHGGNQEDRWWWRLPYRLPGVLTVLVAAGGLWAVVGGWLRPERGWLRPGLYVLLCLGLGCGLLANTLLKEQWGRPRPRDTVAFGGAAVYHAPWEPGASPRWRSFPCGHATIPALGFALWLLWRRRRPALARWSLAGGAVLTAWVAAARLLAQAHWASDVLWAVVIMVVVPSLLHRLLLAPQPDAGPLPSRDGGTPWWRRKAVEKAKALS